MIDSKFALVYVNGSGISEDDEAKVLKALEGVTRFEYRNARLFKFTKNEKDQVLQCDAEVCDVVVTDSDVVAAAYEHTSLCDPEIRDLGLAKKAPARKRKAPSKPKTTE